MIHDFGCVRASDMYSEVLKNQVRYFKETEGGKNREPNRYMGYIAETLETVYFMSNRDKLVIAHTGCEFLV